MGLEYPAFNTLFPTCYSPSHKIKHEFLFPPRPHLFVVKYSTCKSKSKVCTFCEERTYKKEIEYAYAKDIVIILSKE